MRIWTSYTYATKAEAETLNTAIKHTSANFGPFKGFVSPAVYAATKGFELQVEVSEHNHDALDAFELGYRAALKSLGN